MEEERGSRGAEGSTEHTRRPWDTPVLRELSVGDGTAAKTPFISEASPLGTS
jgi:hypothetical protein